MSEEMCYKCIHRGTVENSRHSYCNHPEARAIMEDGDMLRHMMEGYVKENRVRPLLGLRVSADEQGIVGNWCFWPWNFDPIWLRSCTGFEAVKTEKLCANVRNGVRG